MSLWAILREAANDRPNDDPRAVANDLLGSLDRDNLVTLLADEIAGQQRMRVSNVERQAFANYTPTPTAPKGFAPPTDPFAALRGELVALGNGERVEWHLLTIDQHLERVSMLDRMREGLSRTIDRHQLAVRVIRDAGVTCLADLDKKQETKKSRKRAAPSEPVSMAAN